MNRDVFKVVWKDDGKPVSIKAEVVSETFNGWMKLCFPGKEPFNARLSADGWRTTVPEAWAWATELEARRMSLEDREIIKVERPPHLHREWRIQRILDCVWGSMKEMKELTELVNEINLTLQKE